MRTEDGHIIRECLDGDSASFGLLVDKYKESIYALAYSRLRNFHDAEDITQDVFLKAYRNLRTLRRWDSFLVWIRSIAINLCKNRIRAQSRRPDAESIEDQETQILDKASADFYRDEQSSVSRDEALDSISKALESLPEIYQQVLTLHYLGGMSGEQMSQFLGISHANVRQRLSRARRQLREETLAMMSSTYEQQRLLAGFTFRVVEAVKHIKIHPMPRMAGLPWGLSLAAGIIVAVMGLNPSLSILNPANFPSGSPLSSMTRMERTGEIPIESIEIFQTPVIASKQGDSNDEVAEFTDPQHALLMAPWGEKGEWVPGPEMPNARYGASACELRGKIYVIGGVEVWLGTLSLVEEYDPTTGIWKRKADMPTARVGHSASVANGKIYVIGGLNASVSPISTVEEYDPETDTWKKKRDMPTPRANFSTSAADGRIYAVGGWQLHTQLSTVEEYDPVKDVWTKRSSMTTPRDGLSTSAVDGRVYAIGGTIGFGQAAKLLSVVEEYDPKTDTWTKKSSMPTPRAVVATCVVGGRIYAIGGLTDVVSASSILEIYNPVTDIWVQGADMLTPRAGCSISTFNDHIYVFGGAQKALGLAGQQAVPALSSMEVYKTGSRSEDLEAKGKLVAPWGRIKLD